MIHEHKVLHTIDRKVILEQRAQQVLSPICDNLRVKGHKYRES